MSEILGKRLKLLRKKNNVSQMQLMEQLGLKDPGTISKWENNRLEPGRDKIVKIAQMFHVTVDYLMGFADDPKSFIVPKQSTHDIVTSGFNVMYEQFPAGVPKDFFLEIKNVMREEDPEAFKEEFGEISNVSQIDGVEMVPVVSNVIQVSAGNGNAYPQVEWDVAEYMPIPKTDLGAYSWQGAKFNIITVEGDSMEPYINDGDKLLFAEGIEVGPGEVAVVSYNDTLMVKGVLQNKDGTVTLISFNKNFKDRVIDTAQHDFYVLGKALRVISSKKIPSTI